jgi:phage FluMu protein Com
MPRIPASCFRHRALADGTPYVEMHCPACGEVARVFTDHTALPLCVYNPVSCPFAAINLWPYEHKAEEPFSTEPTGPTTTA